jgi:hypothetical protein
MKTNQFNIMIPGAIPPFFLEPHVFFCLPQAKLDPWCFGSGTSPTTTQF